MTNHTIPTAVYLDRLTVELRFPYNAGMVEQLKNAIPASYRTYNADTKVWTVYGTGPQWAAKAVELLQWTFPNARIERYTGLSPQSEAAFRTLHLLPDAPASLVKAARKELALECHPDRGGDHAAMVAINAAADHLESAGLA